MKEPNRIGDKTGNDWGKKYHEAQERAKKNARRIKDLEIELAGKNAVIDDLHEDIRYYRKDWKDNMIQDQGLDE